MIQNDIKGGKSLDAKSDYACDYWTVESIVIVRRVLTSTSWQSWLATFGKSVTEWSTRLDWNLMTIRVVYVVWGIAKLPKSNTFASIVTAKGCKLPWVFSILTVQWFAYPWKRIKCFYRPEIQDQQKVYHFLWLFSWVRHNFGPNTQCNLTWTLLQRRVKPVEHWQGKERRLPVDTQQQMICLQSIELMQVVLAWL